MEESTAIMKARQFIRDSGPHEIPVDVARYAAAANAEIKIRYDLSDDESGQTFPIGDRTIIAVNGNHSAERQRFTILHEIGHIVLDLPSQHQDADRTSTTDLFRYARRPKEEILCDVFAAECLLPHDRFRRDVNNLDISLEALKRLAAFYGASVTSTGSRFAVNHDLPCAFVLIEDNRIRYVSSSTHLRNLRGWIDIGIAPPVGSVASTLIKEGMHAERYDEIARGIWFNNGLSGYDLVAEESALMKNWDQCISLIWVDEEMRSSTNAGRHDGGDEDPLLEELDGVLPWPSKRRRR